MGDDTSNMPDAVADAPSVIQPEPSVSETAVPVEPVEHAEPMHDPAPEPKVEPPPPSPEEDLLAIMDIVVTSLEHVASDRPAGNYLRTLTAQMRNRIEALRAHAETR